MTSTIHWPHMGQFLQGGKNPCFVSLFFYGEPSCGQTMQNKIDFSIDFGWLGPDMIFVKSFTQAYTLTFRNLPEENA